MGRIVESEHNELPVDVRRVKVRPEKGQPFYIFVEIPPGNISKFDELEDISRLGPMADKRYSFFSDV